MSNIKLTSRFHALYMGWWVVIFLALVAILDAAVYLLYTQLWSQQPAMGADPAGDLAMHQHHVVLTLVILSGVFVIAITALAVTSAHRIAGPYLALQRTFDAIRRGDRSRRLKFRDYDRLEDVAEAFNAMMDSLAGPTSPEEEGTAGGESVGG